MAKKKIAPTDYWHRTYRCKLQAADLVAFQISVKETDLFIQADRDLTQVAIDAVIRYRGYIEQYIEQVPAFGTALKPLRVETPAPAIVQEMARAGECAGVGPMAAVAGAMAEHVGRDLLQQTSQVIVENGGDIFLKLDRPTHIAIFAGPSPLSMKIGLALPASPIPLAVCTSSATVGHSLSLGRADAVCVVSADGSLADAAATAIGNRVDRAADIEAAIAFGRTMERIEGIVVVAGDKIGAWGELKLVPLPGKKT